MFKVGFITSREARSRRTLSTLPGLLLAFGVSGAMAFIAPDDRAESWWDASRADRIGFSDRAASACRSTNCDSLQIRSCLNDTLKPPTTDALRSKTIAEVTATCIAGFKPAR